MELGWGGGIGLRQLYSPLFFDPPVTEALSLLLLLLVSLRAMGVLSTLRLMVCFSSIAIGALMDCADAPGTSEPEIIRGYGRGGEKENRWVK